MPSFQIDRFPSNRGAGRSPSGDFTGTRRWRQVRAVVLERAGCRCQIHGPGCTVEATIADHIKPVFLLVMEGGEDLIYDPDACQAVCHTCHAAKTAGERKLATELHGYPVLPTMRSRKRRKPVHPCDAMLGTVE